MLQWQVRRNMGELQPSATRRKEAVFFHQAHDQFGSDKSRPDPAMWPMAGWVADTNRIPTVGTGRVVGGQGRISEAQPIGSHETSRATILPTQHRPLWRSRPHRPSDEKGPVSRSGTSERKRKTHGPIQEAVKMGREARNRSCDCLAKERIRMPRTSRVTSKTKSYESRGIMRPNRVR